MNILVTGGIGHVGRTVVARLLRHGHTVRILDRSAEDAIEDEVWETVAGAEYRQVDITDYESLQGHLDNMDAVVHLAAYPSPIPAPGQELFRVNCSGTFNVYQAANAAGIKRVVSASSINALGYHYGVKGFNIHYFPIDEAHPTYTTDAYSFSKQVLEETGDYFWRREGVSGVSLRFPAVMRLSARWADRIKHYFQRTRDAFDTLVAMPDAEREARIQAALAQAEAKRAERLNEWPHEFQWRRHRPDEPRPPEEVLMRGRTDFWAIIHAEDAAQAVEKGVLAEYEGSHPLYVNDSQNLLGVPSQTLASYFFPDVTRWTRPVNGSETLVSIERARALIGFEPEHSIQAWVSQD